MNDKRRRRHGRRDGLFQKNGWWWIDYVDAESKRHRKKAAPSYEVAKLMYRDKMNAIAKGEVLGLREEGLIVRDFIDKHYWPVVKPTLQVDRAARARGILDRIVATFGARPLAKIAQDEVQRWYADRLGAVSSTSANKELARLKHVYARAIDWRYVKASPAARIKKMREAPGRVRYLTAAEREALLAGANDRLRLYIQVALLTGGRRSDLCRLRWRDVDLDRRIITFCGTKNGSDRPLPMTDDLYALLAPLDRPTDPRPGCCRSTRIPTSSPDPSPG